MSFVYKIVNKINNKIYIGQTTQKINKRFNYHKSHLKRNKHHNLHLQNAWNEYGEQNFEFDVIERDIKLEYLEERENYWINFFNARNDIFGYNILLGRTRKGVLHSTQTKEKISFAKKGHIPWNKGKNLPSPMAGKKHTEETKLKMSNSKKGKRPHNSKFIEKQIIEIKQKYLEGYSFAFLGKEYQTSYQTISNLIKGRTYNNVN